MRAIPSFVLIVVAASGCATGGDKPAPTSAQPSSVPVSAARHDFKKVAPSANYPLTTCVVTGDDLGAMDDRIAYSYDGTEVQFCCPGCVKEFQKDPAACLAKIQAAKK